MRWELRLTGLTGLSRVPLVVSRHPSLVAFILYLVAAIWATWPGVTQLTNTIIGRMGGDNYEHVWYLWWLGRTVFDSVGTPATIPVLNYPSGIYAPLNLTHTPALFFPAILARITTPAIAYNVALILSPVLNALAMYWLALDLTRNQRPAFLGGLLFGFSPHVLGHLQAGHLSQITMVGFSLFTLYLLRMLRQPSWQLAVATGLSAFVAASHPSHLAYFLLPTGIVILARAFRRLRDLKLWAALITAALLTIGLLTPFYAPMLSSHISITAHATELGGSATKSIDLASLLIPPPDNPWLPEALRPVAMRAVTNTDESHGYLGLMAVGLALLGIYHQRQAVTHWVVLTIGALLFSLGPILQFAGRLITLTIDGVEHPLQLPYALLVQLPFFDWSRTPARFGATMHFALALLAAYGLATLLTKLRNQQWQWVVIGVVCITALAERIIAWPFPAASAWQSPALQMLASETSGQAVLNLPVSFTTNNLALYGQTIHQQPIIGGRVFRSTVEDQPHLEFLDSLLRHPPPSDIIPIPHNKDRVALLATYDVGSIVNQHWAENYDPTQRATLIELFGDPFASSTLATIFHIPQSKDVSNHLTFALHPDDWMPPETWGTSSARWFADNARIFVHSPQLERGQLQLTVIPGLQLHRIQISVNGSAITTLIVGDWATYATPTVTLHPGVNEIMFTDLDGSESTWGDLRCTGGTPLAGHFTQPLTCDPHLKGQRQLSAALQLIGWQPNLELHPLAEFANTIVLDTVSWPAEISDQANIHFTINARSIRSVEDDLVVFAHVWDQDGILLTQWDNAPLRGQFATSSWEANQQLGFRVEVPIPSSSLPGKYWVDLGWYTVSSGSRLPVTASTLETHDDVIALGSFIISKQ